ncbi:UbiA family prenyltransferase [Enemella evansiae]|uniref:UbiA family prenyltransferase n=1 Tax=Enemella evansiae TaxID=2016499 RepID=UPI00105D9723|nr:UbiA family prenyltransferase [Enemella evansiae]TDO89717.1 4-hydroxybenzoate polyprenyltransferase [Enemella evansiae]
MLLTPVTGARRESALTAALSGVRTAADLLRQLIRPSTAVLILAQGGFLLSLFAPTRVAVLPMAAAILALLCWYAHAVAVNDLTDLDTDRINFADHPQADQRPLVNGTTTRRQLIAVTIVLAAGLTALTALVSPWLLLALPPMLALNHGYSVRPVRLTGRGGIAQAVLPVGYVLVPATYAWALAGFPRPSVAALVTIAGLYAMFAGRLMLKDLRDVRGDETVGKRTFVLRHGLRTTLLVSAALLGVGLLVMLAGLFAAYRSAWLLIPVAALSAAAAAYGLWRITDEPEIRRQLLWAAIVGRSATGWLFGALLVTAVPGLPVWQTAALLVLGGAMFTAGGAIIGAELGRGGPDQGA